MPWLLLLLTILLGLLALAMFILNRNTEVPASWGSAGGVRDSAVSWLNVFAQSLVLPPLAAGLGALIATRRRENRIGSLLLAIGITAVLLPLVAELSLYGNFTAPRPIAGFQLIAWLQNWLWVILFTLVLLALAIFPTGHFLSRRWQWLVGGAIGLLTIPLLIAAATETPMSSAFQVPNPFVAQHNERLYSALFAIGVPFMPLSIVAVLAEVVARFRRGSLVERQQIKWLVVGLAGMAVVVSVGLVIALTNGPVIGAVMVNLSATLPLLGIGVAVLRYRLYDVDLIINRALVYTSLTILLAVVYFGTVVLLQSLLTAVVGRESPLVLVLSTLVIAALFAPLRRRVQDIIDRRFYRHKYDAQQAMAAFARTVRNETDLDTLTAELAGVVHRTLQPQGVTVWLKPDATSQRKPQP